MTARDLIVMLSLATLIGSALPGQAQPLAPVVEVEEVVYTWVESENGSFPQWTYGSTILSRVGDDLFFSATETIPDQAPLNNVRWVLMKRTGEGWVELQRDAKDRTREDCPICVFPDGRIFMSINPTLTELDARNGPARPLVLEFSPGDLTAAPTVLEPAFLEDALFTDHSYRGFGCDPDREELLLVNVEAYRGQHWSFRNAGGEWSNHGLVEFPSYDSFKGPLPMRYLYPHVVMRDGAAHVFTKGGLEDIDEARHKYRLEKGMKVWLRPALGYCWSPDIANEPLSEWIAAVDVIEQAGEVWNCDLWVDADGDAHLLWWEASIDSRLRPAFFADLPLTWSLNHGVMREGEMVFSETLAEGGEGLRPEKPRWGQFHIAPDDRLFVYYSLHGTGEGCEHPGWTNWVVELTDDGPGEAAQVEVEQPQHMLFMTAKPNGGSPPSDTIELVGRPVGVASTIGYLRIKLFE
jgi:hypothetical protein